jgi:hypothetical protein
MHIISPITLAGLRRNEKKFRRFCGVTVAEFDQLYVRLEPAWQQAEYKRLQRPNRQRGQGGGGDYRLDLETRLLMLLVWMRQYLTTEATGVLFGVSQSTVSRNLSRLLPVLKSLADETFTWSEPPSQPGGRRSYPQLQQEEPDLFAIVDATEQSINRPSCDSDARLAFSGKQRRPTCKSALLVSEEGYVRRVTPSTFGSIPDVTHVRQAGILADIPTETIAVGDAGFVGLYKDLPQHSVLVPHKAARGHPLLPDQKLANRELAAVRIKVENIIAQLKVFQILTHRFRHNVATVHTHVFAIIAALHNWRILDRKSQLWPA